MFPLLLTLSLGCTGGTGGASEISVNDLRILLVNPTNRDPFSGVDTLVLQISADGDVLAEDTFSIDEPPSLPELSIFGAVRIHLTGYAGPAVLSHGRTAEILMLPDQDLTVPMTFLPVNEAIPVLDPMAAERSDHIAVTLPGGRVLLAGGRSPDFKDAYDDVEVYDPDVGGFSPLGTYLPESSYGQSLAWDARREELMISGGYRAGPSGEVTLATAGVFLVNEGRFDVIEDMVAARAGHCLSLFRDNFGFALGGSDSEVMDYLQIDQISGEWTWTEIYLSGAAEQDVTGCALASDGKVFLQGRSAESTGVFDYSDTAQRRSPSVQDAFYPIDPESAGEVIYSEGGMQIPLSNGDVWTGAGINSTTGVSSLAGREFDLASRSFVSGVDPDAARVDGIWDAWIEEDWFVLGCGSPDGDSGRSQTSLELVNLDDGERFDTIELDRARPGCRVNALDDGTLLITGGYDQTDGGEASAAIVVPWLED